MMHFGVVLDGMMEGPFYGNVKSSKMTTAKAVNNEFCLYVDLLHFYG